MAFSLAAFSSDAFLTTAAFASFSFLVLAA